MTGLTPPAFQHIMGSIATAKTGRRRGHHDAQHDARLSPDAPALPLALHHPVPQEGDRDPAGGRPPPLHLRRLRTAGGPAGARSPGARDRPRRQGRHARLEQLPSPGAVFRGALLGRGAAYLEPAAVPRTPRVCDLRRAGQGDLRRRLDRAGPAASREEPEGCQAVRRHGGWSLAGRAAHAGGVVRGADRQPPDGL